MIFGIDKDIIIGVLMCAAVVFVNAAIWLKLFKNALVKRKKALIELEESGEEILPIFEDATVLCKRTAIHYGTSKKYPTHRLVCYVTFSVNGITKELEVTEDVFNRISENQYGTLITRNGCFLNFGDCDIEA